MNGLTAMIAAGLFAATTVAADEVYQGFAQGNPDLRAQPNQFIGGGVTQRGVGDSIDRYQGWGDDNGDLFNRFDASTDTYEAPRIYQGFAGNPDL
jgi:hypothetical protein